MALAKGIPCDSAMLEILRLALSKLSPKELEDYARATPGFLDGGFRATKPQLLRARLSTMLASAQPIDPKLRTMLEAQIRASLETTGSAATLKCELDAAHSELSVLRGAVAKLKKEVARQAVLECKSQKLQERCQAFENELTSVRQELEKNASMARSLYAEFEQRVSASVQTELAHEMARRAQEAAAFAAREAEVGTPSGRIAAAIDSCRDEDLAAWRICLERLDSAHAFQPNIQESLSTILRQRYAGLHYSGSQHPGKDENPNSPLSILRRAIGGSIDAILLIDAHNTLFALQSRYRLPNEHRWPTAQARDWLVRDIVRLLDESQNIRAYIVFDGPERTESSPSRNVMVIYSGGEGEHRADGVLVDQANFLNSARAQNIIIITNDGELSGRASRHGAKNLAPTALLQFL